MIKSWSPSRLEKWESCPRRAKYEIVDKLCPACFDGVLMGPFGDPQVCQACGVTQAIPEAIARGTALHEAAERYIRHGGKLPKDLKNVDKLLKKVRKFYLLGHVQIEVDLCFDRDWNPVSKYTKDAWLRTKLDVLTVGEDVAEVIDWKSGGLDKRTKEVRIDDKYRDQLEIYGTAVMSLNAQVKKVICTLAFIDGPPGRNEYEAGGHLDRKDLPKLQKKWADRSRGILSDTIYAPRASMACAWCPFSKRKGGPCGF